MILGALDNISAVSVTQALTERKVIFAVSNRISAVIQQRTVFIAVG